MKRVIRATDESSGWRKEWNDDYESYFYIKEKNGVKAIISWRDNDGDGYYWTRVYRPGQSGMLGEKYLYPWDRAEKFADELLDECAGDDLVNASNNVLASTQYDILTQEDVEYFNRASKQGRQYTACRKLGRKYIEDKDMLEWFESEIEGRHFRSAKQLDDLIAEELENEYVLSISDDFDDDDEEYEDLTDEQLAAIDELFAKHEKKIKASQKAVDAATVTNEVINEALDFVKGKKGVSIDLNLHRIEYPIDKGLTEEDFMSPGMLGRWFEDNGFNVTFKRSDVEYTTKDSWMNYRGSVRSKGHKAYLRDRLVAEITW